MTTPIEPDSTGNDSPGLNPAWQEVLSVIPEDLHETVTPYFSKWDQSAQERVTKANDSLREWEPYKPFIEHGIKPDTLHEALQVHHTLINNPMELWKALQESYNFGDEEEETETPPAANPAALPKEFQQVQNMTTQLAEYVLEQEKQKKFAVEDAALDKALSEARAKHGEFDEAYVLSQMANKDLDVEQAVEQYHTFVQGILQSNPRPFAPSIMGGSSGGSGYPSQQPVDPTKLNDSARKNLVAQMMEAAAREG